MKIICIGLNYKDHAEEMGIPLPVNPVVFLKSDSSILRNNKPFFIPDFSDNIHYEAEIVLKVCKVGRSIDSKFAHRYFDQISIGIDFTARDIQLYQSKAGMPWDISKSFDGAAPLGKFYPKERFRDIKNLSFTLEKNGITVQQGNSSNLIFGFDAIIAYVSRFFTLKTGDLIFTGTPAGVGAVKRDDRLTAYLEGNKVLDFNVK